MSTATHPPTAPQPNCGRKRTQPCPEANVKAWASGTNSSSDTVSTRAAGILGSSMCLRGAGDVRIPAALVLTVSLLLFVPLAHAFTFASGQGWVRFLPQFGWGAVGGWVAVLI